MYNKQWPLWIMRSINKAFYDSLAVHDLYIEGMTRETRELEKFFELRADGPKATEESKNYWKLEVIVNILIQIAKVDDTNNIEDQYIGIASAALSKAINVYRYGTTAESILNDETLLGCLSRMPIIEPHRFGLIEPSTDIIHATVEARYEMFISV